MSDTSKLPVLLLDVDGVLNASRAGWSEAPRAGWATCAGVRFRMRWSPKLMTRLCALHASNTVEIQWATSWVGETSQLETLFGLPTFPDALLTSAAVAGREITSIADIQAAKRAAALDVVSADRRLIWVDDEAFSGNWPPRAFIEADGHLLIQPKPSRGLRPEDMDRIELFLR